MDKETDNFEDDEDYDIDKLLAEDEDSPVEKVTEEPLPKPKSKGRGRPKGSVKKEVVPEVPIEIVEAEKDLLEMEWEMFEQQAYSGYRNIKTGEIIDNTEAIRRTLNYAQEAARNSR